MKELLPYMAKQKIFFDATALIEDKISGIGHVLLNLLIELEKNPAITDKYELVLLAPRYGMENLERWGFKNVTYKAIPFKPRIIQILTLLKIKLPMDIFIGKGTYIFINYRNWKLRSSKSITYIHDLGYLHYPEFLRKKTLQLMKRSVPIWIKQTDIVVAGSDYTKQEICRFLHVPGRKIEAIHHGVDLTTFNKKPTKEVNNAKKRYGIEGKYILFVGNIEPRKNLSRLVQAYAQLPKKLTNMHSLVIVGGNGWNNQSILNEIKEAQDTGLKVIQPSQYVVDKDLPALISGATVLVHPAVYEGFGLPPLQAMACRTPVLVANNSSLPEVVGDSGLYVNAMSVRSITEKMKVLLTDEKLRKDLAKKGHKRAQKFSWKSSADQLIELVDSL